VAIVAAAAVAALATMAVALPERNVAERPSTASTSTGTPRPATTGEQTFPANGAFDLGMTGWVATPGAVVSWQASGHVGGSALVRVSSQPAEGEIPPPATSTVAPGSTVTGLVAQDAAPPAAPGATLQGTAWVRSSAADVTVIVRLREHVGDQEVADSRQEVRLTADQDWQQVTVGHPLAQEGTKVDLEILAIDLPANAAVGIDSVAITVAT
jgi:hypothetical protein